MEVCSRNPSSAKHVPTVTCPCAFCLPLPLLLSRRLPLFLLHPGPPAHQPDFFIALLQNLYPVPSPLTLDPEPCTLDQPEPCLLPPQGDFLMALLRDLLPLRRAEGRPLKVVLMSATLDANLFAKYFDGCISKDKHHTEEYSVRVYCRILVYCSIRCYCTALIHYCDSIILYFGAAW